MPDRTLPPFETKAIAELERLEAKATAGEWSVDPYELMGSSEDVEGMPRRLLAPGRTVALADVRAPSEPHDAVAEGCWPPDASFIAVFRNAAPRLLASARRERELAELVGAFVRLMDLWVDHADEMIPAGVTLEKWNADLMSDFRENVRPLLARPARVGQEGEEATE